MMKKIIALTLVLVLGLTLLCGCEGGNTASTEATVEETTVPVTEVQADYTEVYTEVLDRYYGIITSEEDTMLIGEGNTGVYEAIAELDKETALGVVGYTFKDLTGDGFAELIVGAVADNEDSWYKTSEIFAVYTIAHNMPFMIAEGRARSSYHLLEDGTFFYEGSGGAAYSGVGNFRVSQGGTSLICNDFYFTEPDKADPNVVTIYHNTTGKWDVEKAEKTELTANDFSDIRKGYSEKAVTLELTPFSQYK